MILYTCPICAIGTPDWMCRKHEFSSLQSENQRLLERVAKLREALLKNASGSAYMALAADDTLAQDKQQGDG